MLVIDGVKYKLWTPKDEEKEFHPMIKEHSKEIFGEESLYFDVKQKIVSKTGIGSIPDGYVISFSKPLQWFIVEGELSSHPLYDHIVKQLNKFMSGIKNPDSQKEILNALYDEITKRPTMEAYVKEMIESKEIYYFLSDLISKSPKVVIIIEEKSDEVKEACENLKTEPIIVEFKTFVREDAENVHAHLFEPLYTPEYKIKKPEIIQKEVPLISIEELKSLGEGTVIICPSKLEGINFLLKYNAWGFIRIKKKPDYLALYVSKPESKILYFGEVEDIVTPEDPSSPISIEEAHQYKTFEEGKKVVVLKHDSLRKLEKEIPKGVKKGKMQGIRFVTLTQFINAETTDDL